MKTLWVACNTEDVILFATEDEARRCAEKALEAAEVRAAREGEWDDDITEIFWGQIQVRQRAVFMIEHRHTEACRPPEPVDLDEEQEECLEGYSLEADVFGEYRLRGGK